MFLYTLCVCEPSSLEYIDVFQCVCDSYLALRFFESGWGLGAMRFLIYTLLWNAVQTLSSIPEHFHCGMQS